MACRADAVRDFASFLHAVVHSVVRRANETRRDRGDAPILSNVTPHTLRRSYISFMLAAGYDLPYVQAQVGHENPTTTLGIYARVIHQPDRERVRVDLATPLRGNTSEVPPDRPTHATLF